MARPTLPHPPSDRYAPSGGEVARSDVAVRDAGSSSRASWRPELGAGLVAAATAAVLVLMGGLLALTTGLLFVAGVGSALTGLVLAASPRPRSTLRVIAIVLAVAAVVVGAVGGWLIALDEGGALGLLDYLWAVTGLLVPVEALVAALAAAWGVGAGPIRP